MKKALEEHRLAEGIDEQLVILLQRLLDYISPRTPRHNQAHALDLATTVWVNTQTRERLWCRVLTHAPLILRPDTLPMLEDPVARAFDFPLSITVRPLELLAYSVTQDEPLDSLAELRAACAYLRDQIEPGAPLLQESGNINWEDLAAKISALSADSWDDLAALRTFICNPIIDTLQSQLILNERKNFGRTEPGDRFITEAERVRSLLFQIYDVTSTSRRGGTLKAYVEHLGQALFRVHEEVSDNPARHMYHVDERASGQGILRAVRYSDYLSVYWSAYAGLDAFLRAVRRAWPTASPLRAIVEGGQGVKVIETPEQNAEQFFRVVNELDASLVQLQFSNFLVLFDTLEIPGSRPRTCWHRVRDALERERARVL